MAVADHLEEVYRELATLTAENARLRAALRCCRHRAGEDGNPDRRKPV